MSNLYRGPPIDASYKVLVHLAKQFQRRRLKKIGQSETRLLTDQNDISNRNRGLSIDASYQVSVHLAKLVFFKSANQKQESPVVAMFVNGSGRNEHSL